MNLYLTSTLILVALAAIGGLSLNIQWGLGGLINFGLFGFYMLGAYICALLTLSGVTPLLAMAIAVAITALISAMVSFVSIRLSEDYLAIVTLGFAECLRILVTNEEWLTKGTVGLPGIVRPFSSYVTGAQLDLVFLAFVLLCVVLVFVVYELVARSPFGRTLRAVREDPVVAETLGKNVQVLRLKAFALGGAMIAVAGSLHAFYYTYIDPTQFTTIITAYAFMTVILGGRGSGVGVLFSAFTVVFLLEGSRFLVDYIGFLDAAQLAAIRLMFIGAALVVILIFRPQGYFSEPRLRVKPHV